MMNNVSVYAAFVDCFGSYTPIVTTLADGSEHVSCDWSYIGMVAIVCIVFWCCLRVIGGIICAK